VLEAATKLERNVFSGGSSGSLRHRRRVSDAVSDVPTSDAGCVRRDTGAGIGLKEKSVDRRTLLARGGMALVALTLPGCATRRAARVAVAGGMPLRLAPVRVSWDRIIRATVGLRPHRPSGFVLRAEQVDGKTIIHNYGHGGAGMSLSWGTAAMAADLALAHSDRRAAVLGSGVVGLTTARQLQRRGFDVTIYAATVPPDTTSNMSLAGFTPTSGLVSFDRRTPAWDEQFRQAVQIAYRQLQLLVGPRYGISWISNYSPTEQPQAARGTNTLLPDSVRTGNVLLGPGEHPFSSSYCIERPEMRIEPSIYLDALMQDVAVFGAKTRIRRFESIRDVMALDESVIVNCTGLGAKAIFGDSELVPLKGQLIVLIPQEDVNYSTNGGVRVTPSTEGLFAHMMPRRDGIILGGTSERDVWTMEVNDAERTRVVEGHREMFEEMQARMR
jgi:glycine/D-amino acid oxidase-like deaminating enzyme